MSDARVLVADGAPSSAAARGGSPKVKVCGVTNLADAETAVALGAWAVGMIFYDGSPRRCSLAEAQRISAALRRKAAPCGVFVNAPLEEVVALAEELQLGMLQLHGEEGPSFCAETKRRLGVPVIKARQVSGPGDVRDMERYHVDFHLLDARARTPGRQEERGGTVERAIALTRPSVVDTASGTESAPGRKDPNKLRAFFDAVNRTTIGPARIGQPA